MSSFSPSPDVHNCKEKRITTIESLLTDNSIRRTPDISLRLRLGVGSRGICLRESWLYETSGRYFPFQGGGVWIVLLPKVIPSEKDVATILFLIVVWLYIYTLLGNFKIQIQSPTYSHLLASKRPLFTRTALQIQSWISSLKSTSRIDFSKLKSVLGFCTWLHSKSRFPNQINAPQNYYSTLTVKLSRSSCIIRVLSL